VAYVPGFQYDVFVSYARSDDSRLSEFVRDIRKYLTREFGTLFADECVFFDQQGLNHAPTEWKKKLKESAESAAILVPFLSPSYATSDYCAKEWEWFCKEHPLRWKTGSETVYRVCPVEWRPLDEEMQEQIAPEILDAQVQQSLSVEELGRKIANGLRLMRRSRQTVFVGECEHDVRQEVWNEMSRMGFRVMPSGPMAFGNSALIREHICEARLAVHFAGGHDQQRPFEAIKWSLKECQGATVVYEVPGHDLTREERFEIERIEYDFKLDPRYHHVRQNFNELVHVLRDLMEGARPVRPTPLGIACEETDRPAVEAIIPEIQTRTGFEVTCHGLSLFDLKKSPGVLFYWGAAEGGWLRQARKARPAARDAFFLAPPPKPSGYEQDLAGTYVFRQQGERFQVDEIRPFLQELGWAG
jgi:hypothetical protein